ISSACDEGACLMTDDTAQLFSGVDDASGAPFSGGGGPTGCFAGGGTSGFLPTDAVCDADPEPEPPPQKRIRIPTSIQIECDTGSVQPRSGGVATRGIKYAVFDQFNGFISTVNVRELLTFLPGVRTSVR